MELFDLCCMSHISAPSSSGLAFRSVTPGRGHASPSKAITPVNPMRQPEVCITSGIQLLPIRDQFRSSEPGHAVQRALSCLIKAVNNTLDIREPARAAAAQGHKRRFRQARQSGRSLLSTVIDPGVFNVSSIASLGSWSGSKSCLQVRRGPGDTGEAAV